MGKRDYFKDGDYNAICDRCGIKFKASECKPQSPEGNAGGSGRELFVCNKCWDPRHPQNFVRGLKDDQRVPIARPRGEIQFITEDVVPEDL